MLDGRDIKLIDIIDAHPDIDPVDLAERFSVSDRSVRTYVRKTNEALGSCAQIEKRRGGGYSLPSSTHPPSPPCAPVTPMSGRTPFQLRPRRVWTTS